MISDAVLFAGKKERSGPEPSLALSHGSALFIGKVERVLARPFVQLSSGLSTPL